MRLEVSNVLNSRHLVWAAVNFVYNGSEESPVHVIMYGY